MATPQKKAAHDALQYIDTRARIPREAGEILGMHEDLVRQLCREGKIGYYRDGPRE